MELAGEYKGKIGFARFNVSNNTRNRSIALRNGVMDASTIAFYCGSRYLGSIVGFISKEHLIHVIEDMIK